MQESDAIFNSHIRNHLIGTWIESLAQVESSRFGGKLERNLKNVYGQPDWLLSAIFTLQDLALRIVTAAVTSSILKI
jgi:hypothetical protein